MELSNILHDGKTYPIKDETARNNINWLKQLIDFLYDSIKTLQPKLNTIEGSVTGKVEKFKIGRAHV